MLWALHKYLPNNKQNKGKERKNIFAKIITSFVMVLWEAVWMHYCSNDASQTKQTCDIVLLLRRFLTLVSCFHLSPLNNLWLLMLHHCQQQWRTQLWICCSNLSEQERTQRHKRWHVRLPRIFTTTIVSLLLTSCPYCDLPLRLNVLLFHNKDKNVLQDINVQR